MKAIAEHISPLAGGQKPSHRSPALAVKAGIRPVAGLTLPEQVCTEPSPMRKFKVVGWPVENQATPAGGLGGGEHILALTPTTSARGVSTVLPRTRLLAVVPQGLVPPGPLPPPPPR